MESVLSTAFTAVLEWSSNRVDAERRGLSEELVLLDASCPQITSLQPASLLPSVALATDRIGSDAEALTAIKRELDERRALGLPVRTLHLVAHGRPGAFRLGRHWIDAATLLEHRAVLAGWRLEHLALWSCHTGADTNFVALLEELTGARVWSSPEPVATRKEHGTSRLRTRSRAAGSPSERSLEELFVAAELAQLNVVLLDLNVLFETGSIGTQGTNPQQLNNAFAFESQGIARIGFFQADGTGATGDVAGSFDIQGNDIPGYIRVYLLDGSSFTVSGSIVWRYPNSGSSDQFGFVPSQSATWIYNGTSYGITGGAGSGNTNILLRSFNATSSVVDGGTSATGNAATQSVATALNSTLAASSVPTTITGDTQVEGNSLTYTVTLDAATSQSQLLAYNFTGTATQGSTSSSPDNADYNTTASSYVFTAYDSLGNVIPGGIVNNLDGTITLAATGISSFTMQVSTFTDQVTPEANETAILTFGTVTGTGTILDNPATVVCFLAGTLIATPDGPRPVETLQPGDLVLTPEGAEPVRFLGVNRRGQKSMRAMGRMPVGIEAGALGHLGPECTTFVSPSHAFFLEGALVEAGALLNGSTIRQHNDWPNDGQIAYYSIELERHALVWANGLLAESFYPTGDLRLCWNNYDEYVSLYGEQVDPMEEMAAPRIPFARQLPPAIRELIGIGAETLQLVL